MREHEWLCWCWWNVAIYPVGRMWKKQALHDSSLHTKLPCFAGGGEAGDDDVTPTTGSYTPFGVAVSYLKRYCCELFRLGLCTITNSNSDFHQHQRIGRVGKEDLWTATSNFLVPFQRITEQPRIPQAQSFPERW
jgi:hypothetical protein